MCVNHDRICQPEFLVQFNPWLASNLNPTTSLQPSVSFSSRFTARSSILSSYCIRSCTPFSILFFPLWFPVSVFSPLFFTATLSLLLFKSFFFFYFCLDSHPIDPWICCCPYAMQCSSSLVSHSFIFASLFSLRSSLPFSLPIVFPNSSHFSTSTVLLLFLPPSYFH